MYVSVPLTDPTKVLVYKSVCIETVDMAVQEEHVWHNSVEHADRVRYVGSPVEGTENDRSNSSTGNSNFGLWQGHAVNYEFVFLLNVILNRDVFADLKNLGFNIRIDDTKSKFQDLQTLRGETMQEIQKTFGTMVTNLAVGCIGAPPQNSRSEEDLKLLMDERKRKMMISNRESARRQKKRKQMHLEYQMAKLNQLKTITDHISTSVSVTTALPQHDEKRERSSKVKWMVLTSADI
ncbi:hypothetical protein POM88_043063 [Heracleum sosnowskyi]|uniref:BZIP domain-containing protein n=1 Tax=Heracleum sosnowskyi TaxID=360622 RepID=A0AAD8H2M6_9APIA|nr:hypothetical protein POM88_043063 [Heracleum sosnowskyi]